MMAPADRNPNSVASLDWSLLRAFAEVAQSGSVLRAAQVLELTQPTLSRQIAALEAAVGYALFVRSTRGMRLTPRGQALLEPVMQMREQSFSAGRIAQGQQENISGLVRISASEIVSSFMLPAMLCDLQKRHPGLEFAVQASNTLSNLVEREADIAVRMIRPRQAGLITRHVADFRVVMAAHRQYLARAGMPTEPSRLFEWSMIGFDQDRSLEKGFAQNGIPPRLQRWAYRSDSHAVCWQLVQQGAGIGFVTDLLVDAHPDIVRVMPDLPTPHLPVWLTVHRDLRSSPRLKAVYEALAEAFATLSTA